jgi:hypothetical protein
MPTPRSASRARTVGLAITLGSSIEFGDDVPVCPCCDERLRKIGEDVTETLELMPRQWKVIAHAREKSSCRVARPSRKRRRRAFPHPGLSLCGSGRSFRCKPPPPRS